MGIEHEGVTDVTDVTVAPYKPHTGARAYGVYGEDELHRLHRLQAIDGQSGELSPRATDFVQALPDDEWVVAAPDRFVREAVRAGAVERQKLAPGVYRFRKAMAR